LNVVTNEATDKVEVIAGMALLMATTGKIGSDHWNGVTYGNQVLVTWK
jgi:hypothetical protein